MDLFIVLNGVAINCFSSQIDTPILFEPTGLSYASSLRVHVTSVNNANQVITVVTSAGTESKIGKESHRKLQCNCN